MRRFLCAVVGLALLGGWAQAAEPRVVFEDRLEGKVGEGWSWLREDAKTWRIKDGALEIRVEPGVAPSVKNALLRKAPDWSKRKHAFEVTITFTADPTRQYEQAGITLYQGTNPVFKLVHEFIDGKTYIIPGKIPTTTKTMQLRLVTTPERYIAQFRPDGKGEFQTAASAPLPRLWEVTLLNGVEIKRRPMDEQISIQCYNGPPDAEHWIRFDDFRILELAD